MRRHSAPFADATSVDCLTDFAHLAHALLLLPRPGFKYYSWQSALIGAVLNLGVMVYLSWVYALATFVALALLYTYLTTYGPATDWGDITNELIFHQARLCDCTSNPCGTGTRTPWASPPADLALVPTQVRKYLLRLEQTGVTPTKYWKPNLLVLVDNCDTGLLAFCNSLKKGGLLVVAQVESGCPAGSPCKVPICWANRSDSWAGGRGQFGRVPPRSRQPPPALGQLCQGHKDQGKRLPAPTGAEQELG